MGDLLNIVSDLHKSTKRDHLARMLDEKVECMKIARKYDKHYWDGDRRYGYGGYKYIPNRWKQAAQNLIDKYKLGPGSTVLDVGCGKGFLLHEMLLIQPDLNIQGFDISEYGISCATELVRSNLSIHKAQSLYPYADNSFDLVISMGALHNLKIFELKVALEEIQRVAKYSYVMVESYRSELELFNLQCWALTCESFFDTDEWIWIFENFGYSGDYEFIFFE